jgi:hypothetical protein
MEESIWYEKQRSQMKKISIRNKTVNFLGEINFYE